MTTFSPSMAAGRKYLETNPPQLHTFVPFAFITLNASSYPRLSHRNILYYAGHKTDNSKGEVKNTVLQNNKFH
jgi:hypothetical protein